MDVYLEYAAYSDYDVRRLEQFFTILEKTKINFWPGADGLGLLRLFKSVIRSTFPNSCDPNLWKHVKPVFDFYNFKLDPELWFISLGTVDLGSFILDANAKGRDRKITIFCLTNDYLASDNFQKAWLEAKNRTTLVVILQKGLNLSKLNLEDNELIFRLYRNEIESYLGDELQRFFSKIQSILGIDISEDVKQLYNSTPAQKIYKNIRYELFLSYIESEFGESIQEINNSLKNANFKIFESNQQIHYLSSEFDDVLNAIEKSCVLIQFLTNEYLGSEKFKNEFKVAKDKKKNIIFVLMEEIVHRDSEIEFDKLTTVDYYRDSREGLKRIYGFILRFFQRDHHLVDNRDGTFNITPINWSMNKYYSTESPISFIGNAQIDDIADKTLASYKILCLCHMPEKNMVLKVVDNAITVIDCVNFNEQKLHMLESKPAYSTANTYTKNFIYIDEINSIYFYNKENTSLCCLDENFQLLQLKHVKCSSLISLEYSKVNKKLYLSDKRLDIIQIYDLNLNLVKSIQLTSHPLNTSKLFKDKIYVFGRSIGMYIYDLDVNYLSTIWFPFNEIPYAIDIDESNPDYMFISMNSGMKVFHMNSLKYVSDIVNTRTEKIECTLIANGKYLELSYKNLKIFNIYYNMKNGKLSRNEGIQKYVDEMFICKLNILKQHIYQDPYILPCCGNTACLDCIYDNFNIFTDTFKCNFESCKIEYCLKKGELKRNEKLSSSINENCRDISEGLIIAKRKLLQKIEDHIESIDSKINYFNDVIECRMESINIEIDKMHEKLISQLANFENRLLKKKKKIGRANLIQMSDYKIKREKIIGVLHEIVTK